MTQHGDYPGGRGPVYTKAAGFGPQGQHSRTRPPATPAQWQRDTLPRQDPRPTPQFSYLPDSQPAFTPDPWRDSQQPGGQYPPPQPSWQQQPTWQQPYQPQPQYAPQPPHRQQWQQPRKKRRVFLWVFLGIQAIFLIWIIAGIAGTSHTGADAHTQAVQFCASKANWQYLYKSQADCIIHYGNVLNGASDAGKGIGVALIVVVWIVVDFFTGLGYGIYRLASRR
jgi:hypothetical protein